VAVDASEEYVLATRAKVSSKTRVIQAFFEELEFDETFDTIVMGHILEHILDPVALLARAQQWLSPNSAILVIVPNAWSLHRLAAVEMGLLASPEQLNETDHRLGHRRVYTPETLRADIEKAGLVVGQTGGIFLKVLSNSQLENQWSPEMIEAYYKLGFRFPEYGAEIYAECLLP
jgi:2-polyprenyl-3-methyl-5-hydroxy-6-metoxy-1,4-benzoquinol methylase